MKILPFILGVIGLTVMAAKAESVEVIAPVAVGDKAQLFTLKDTTGAEQSLASYLKKGPVALVFFRSGDW